MTHVDTLWLAGDRIAAARAYVDAYFAEDQRYAFVDIAPCALPELTDQAVDVAFTLGADKTYGFTIWWEPTIDALYGEW